MSFPNAGAELEQHIDHCEECARAAQRLLGVRQALKSSLIDRDMPAHLVVLETKLRADLRVSGRPSSARRPFRRLAAVIFLAIVSVGWFW